MGITIFLLALLIFFTILIGPTIYENWKRTHPR